MIDKMHKALEFDKVLEMLAERAISENAKTRIHRLEPFLSFTEANRHLTETTEARKVMEHSGNPPLSTMEDLDKNLSMLGKGTFLQPEGLSGIAGFLTACRRMKAYLKKAEATDTGVAAYGNSFHDLSDIEYVISDSIRGGQVDDKASPRLAELRRKIENAGGQIKGKLESLLRNNKDWFSEGFVAIRNGHYTLPVKREYKSRVSGTVIDVSQSGGTYFIEPASAAKLREELSLLKIAEENEVIRILYQLTGLVEEHLPFIRVNADAMETLDFLFAKAKLSIDMQAAPVPVTLERRIEIRAGRHPLLKSDKVVPLDFSLGTVGKRGVAITGPNTGGKTVALKTVGLLSLMAQSGLHVPAEGESFTMNNHVLCDIGDGQSISENLSTFSSHMTNIIRILKAADDQSLVLLDELGSGTDPAEGMGLAVAVLEELLAKNCLFVTTTHYPEIKEFARTTAGLVNARMAFDRESLMPLYRLEMGEAGESCALYIARRLGLPQRLVERAREAAYGEMARNSSKGAEADLPVLKPADTNTGYTAVRRIKSPERMRPMPDSRSQKFNIGDSVMVYPQKMIGIVYQKTNEKGEVGIQLRKSKILVNHKRLQLQVPAGQLYPENYDFSVIFDSVAVRKAHRVMERRHEPGLVIPCEDGRE